MVSQSFCEIATSDQVASFSSAHVAGLGSSNSKAELELTTDKAERIALRERRLANMKELEELTRAMQEVGKAGFAEVFTTTATRIKAEIELLRERARP